MMLMLVLFAGLLPELRRAEACLLSENAREVRRVVVIEFVGYLLGRQAGIGEQAPRLEQYPLHDDLAGVHAGLRLHELVELLRAHVQHVCIITHQVYFPEIPLHQIFKFSQRHKGGVVDRLFVKIILIEKVAALEQEDVQIAAQHILPDIRIAGQVLAQMPEDIEQLVKILLPEVEHRLGRVVIEKGQRHEQVFFLRPHRIKFP